MDVDDEEEMVQKHPSPITLSEFFPQGFFTQTQTVSVNMVSVDLTGDQTEYDGSAGGKDDQSKEAPPTIQDLLNDPRLHSLLQSSEAVRNQVIMALRDPKKSAPQDTAGPSRDQASQLCAACYSTIAFSDEDLLLGSKPHN